MVWSDVEVVCRVAVMVRLLGLPLVLGEGVSRVRFVLECVMVECFQQDMFSREVLGAMVSWLDRASDEEVVGLWDNSVVLRSVELFDGPRWEVEYFLRVLGEVEVEEDELEEEEVLLLEWVLNC